MDVEYHNNYKSFQGQWIDKKYHKAVQIRQMQLKTHFKYFGGHFYFGHLRTIYYLYHLGNNLDRNTAMKY